jgi:hypothetical protein
VMAWTSLPKAPSASDVIAIGLMADISMAHYPLRDRSEPGTRAVVRNHQLEAQLKTVYNGMRGGDRPFCSRNSIYD